MRSISVELVLYPQISINSAPVYLKAFKINSDLQDNVAVHFYFKVADGQVVRAAISVMRNVLS